MKTWWREATDFAEDHRTFLEYGIKIGVLGWKVEPYLDDEIMEQLWAIKVGLAEKPK